MLPIRRSVLLCVTPVSAQRILTGQKTIDLRQGIRMATTQPIDALVYAGGTIKAVVGIVRIVATEPMHRERLYEGAEQACIPMADLDLYHDALHLCAMLHLAQPRAINPRIGLREMRDVHGVERPETQAHVPDTLRHEAFRRMDSRAAHPMPARMIP